MWPKAPASDPLAQHLNTMPKLVASRTLTEVGWQNSTLLVGDAVDSVTALKNSSGPNLVVLGCGDLVQSLRRGGLVDEYMLLVHPVLLGKGSRLFPDGPPAQFRLVDSVPTSTGVIIATYQSS